MGNKVNLNKYSIEIQTILSDLEVLKTTQKSGNNIDSQVDRIKSNVLKLLTDISNDNESLSDIFKVFDEK